MSKEIVKLQDMWGGVMRGEVDIETTLNAARTLKVDTLKKVLTLLDIAPKGHSRPGRWRADASKLERLRVFSAAMHEKTHRPSAAWVEKEEDPFAEDVALAQVKHNQGEDETTQKLEMDGPDAVPVPRPTTTESDPAMGTLQEALEEKLKDKMTPNEIAQLATEVAEAVCEEKLKDFAPPEYAAQIEITRPDMPEIDPIDVGVQHENFPELLALVNCRTHVWAWGSAGTGKTVAAEHVAKALDLAFHPYSVGAGTMPSDMTGFIVPGNGKYQGTGFRDAFENGGVFLLDEADKGSAQVMTKLNAALANGYMAFPDGLILQHDDFICVACANGGGLGQSRQYKSTQQDGALLNRFTYQHWDYDNKLENALFPIKSWCGIIQEIRRAVKDLNVETIISMRASKDGCKILLGSEIKPERALQLAVYKQTGRATQERIESWIDGHNDFGHHFNDRLALIIEEIKTIKAT